MDNRNHIKEQVIEAAKDLGIVLLFIVIAILAISAIYVKIKLGLPIF